ncbi:MAG: type II secretion system minor pseudopilin GspK [Gammaproteobacteria bacterium]|nr:type II secretion system minor pseudopilin GspK [Gammaproteobacteria bacterium]
MRAQPSEGVALISVLLVVAVLTSVVYHLVSRHASSIAQSQNALGFDQAMAYALGGEALARQVLYRDRTETGPDIDSFEEDWARAFPPFELDEQGVIEIQARDLNGCFNLNALAGEEPGPHLDRFKTLLRNLDMPEPIADETRDWIDADQAVLGFGAEDNHYLGLRPAYRTSGQPLAHVSELRLMRSMTPEHLQRLRPHVCVLPVNALKLNVNTATSHALAALAPELNESELRLLTETPRAFANLAEFTKVAAGFETVAPHLGVMSEFFEVQVRVSVGDGTAMLTSVLRRDPESSAITLISRDLGRDFRPRLIVETEDA